MIDVTALGVRAINRMIRNGAEVFILHVGDETPITKTRMQDGWLQALGRHGWVTIAASSTRLMAREKPPDSTQVTRDTRDNNDT